MIGFNTTNSRLNYLAPKHKSSENDTNSQLPSLVAELKQNIDSVSDSIFSDKYKAMLQLPVSVLNMCVADSAITSRNKIANLQAEEIKLIIDAIDKIRMLMQMINKLYSLLQKKDAHDKALASDPNKVQGNDWGSLADKALYKDQFNIGTYWFDQSGTPKGVDFEDAKRNGCVGADGKCHYADWEGWNYRKFLGTGVGQFLLKHGYIKMYMSDQDPHWQGYDELLKHKRPDGKLDVQETGKSYIMATDKLINMNFILDVNNMTEDERKDWEIVQQSHDVEGKSIFNNGIIAEETSDWYFSGESLEGVHIKDKIDYYDENGNKKDISSGGYIQLDEEDIESDPYLKRYIEKLHYDSPAGRHDVFMLSKDGMLSYVHEMEKLTITILQDTPKIFERMDSNIFSDQNSVKTVSDSLSDIVDKRLVNEQKSRTDAMDSLQEDINRFLTNFLAALRAMFGNN